jgi:hypothetical protein
MSIYEFIARIYAFIVDELNKESENMLHKYLGIDDDTEISDENMIF